MRLRAAVDESARWAPPHQPRDVASQYSLRLYPACIFREIAAMQHEAVALAPFLATKKSGLDARLTLIFTNYSLMVAAKTSRQNTFQIGGAGPRRARRCAGIAGA
jgi:hypothetical protein